MNRLKPASRIIIAIASLSLIATYFLPVWFIYLLAPQYPEGLTMQIWLTHLSGEVDIINGLNHYIGMAKINEAMFPEFGFLVYIVAFYILSGLVVALVGKRSFFTGFLVLLGVGAIAALVDFYQWGYKYGHNLDPTAPIQVPGLYYQPPVVGHKQLLNFDAYSYPDTGGWVVIVAGLIFFAVWIIEWRRQRSKATAAPISRAKKAFTPALATLLFAAASCSTAPAPLEPGIDQCHECNMTIMEPKYGSQVITKKGKSYKFDDAYCLATFIRSGSVAPGHAAQTFFVSYSDSKAFIPSDKAFFVVSPQLKTPMNSHAAALDSRESAESIATLYEGKVFTWNDLLQQL